MGFINKHYQGKRLAGAQRPEPEVRVEETVQPPEPEVRPVEKEQQAEPEVRVEETAQPPEPEVPAGRKKKAGADEEKHGFWSDYGYLLVTAAVVLLVFRVLLQLAYVPTASMESTVPKESLLLSWQLPYLVSDPEPQRGDVITFWNEEMGKILVKRVIGLPGEEITFVDGYVYVNGEKLSEPYLDQQGATLSPYHASYLVPEGCLFMLGDNRPGSQDSRSWDDPFITFHDVQARVMVCIPVRFYPVSFLPNFHGIPLPSLGRIHLVG